MGGTSLLDATLALSSHSSRREREREKLVGDRELVDTPGRRQWLLPKRAQAIGMTLHSTWRATPPATWSTTHIMPRHTYFREHIFCLIPKVKRQKSILLNTGRKGALKIQVHLTYRVRLKKQTLRYI